MKRYITKDISWTPAMIEFTEKEIDSKLAKFGLDLEKANISITKVPKDKIKITLAIESFRAQAINEDFYTAVVKVVKILKSIIAKHTKKYLNKRVHTLETHDTVEPMRLIETDLISKEKLFDLTPTTLETAVEEFEQTDYEFYVFKDKDYNNTITIIYKRFASSYGLIRCN